MNLQEFSILFIAYPKKELDCIFLKYKAVLYERILSEVFDISLSLIQFVHSKYGPL